MSWRGFVVIAGMRTGSNHLESSIDAMAGATCHGEAFNPHFLGYPNREALLGYDLARRGSDPLGLLGAIQAQPGLNGFRFFRDHDPRALAAVLADRGVAKVMLSRDLVQSFVSLQIARATNQWKLTRAAHRRSTRIVFDPAAYEAHRAAETAFADDVRRRLRTDGQTWFQIDYDEISDLAILNGLADWLGVGRLERLPGKLVRQNPPDLRDKVENHDEMVAALGGVREVAAADPKRPALVPTWQAAAGRPLLHQPVPGGPSRAVTAWLTAACGAPPRDGMTQKDLRRWMRGAPGHRAFAVVAHPVVRAWRLLVHLREAEDRRRLLHRDHGLDLGAAGAGPKADRAALIGLMAAVRAILNGQGSEAPDAWTLPQVATLAGFAAVRPPDVILREVEMGAGLAALAGTSIPAHPSLPEGLAEVHDPDLEAAVRAAWPKDYLTLGFADWRPA